MPAADTTVTAVFEPIPTFRLNISASLGGVITEGAAGNYLSGTVINIAAAPNEGYRFKNWTSSDGGVFGDAYGASTVFTMPSNATTVTAHFEPVEEILKVVVTGEVRSYHPYIPTMIRLSQGGEVRYSTVIAPGDGTGQQAQSFVFRDVQPGVYDLEITKAAHLPYIYQSFDAREANVVIGEITLALLPLESIEVTVLPLTSYIVGETLNLTGMAVSATYEDGTTITVDGYATTPANGDLLNVIGIHTVTVEFEGKTDSFIITVNDAPDADGDYVFEFNDALYSSWDSLHGNIMCCAPADVRLLKDFYFPILLMEKRSRSI